MANGLTLPPASAPTANQNRVFRALDVLSGGILGGVTGDARKRREDSILREQQIRAAVEDDARRRAMGAAIIQEATSLGLTPVAGPDGQPDIQKTAILAQTKKVELDAIRQAALIRAREEEQARLNPKGFQGIVFNSPQELEQRYPAAKFGYEVTPLADGKVGVAGGFRPRVPDEPKPARSLPPGYEEDPENRNAIRPIPGGPADAEKKDKQARFQRQIEGETYRAKNLITQIDEVLANANAFTVGPAGKLASVVWGTDAYDLGSLLTTIKANIGFDRLQEMRKESPTGGALGQVAVQELVALQNSIASLEQAQKPDQFKRNLKRVRDHYERYIRAESGDESVKEAPSTKPQNEVRVTFP